VLDSTKKDSQFSLLRPISLYQKDYVRPVTIPKLNLIKYPGIVVKDNLLAILILLDPLTCCNNTLLAR